jgi:predicted metal-dependent peptidase
MNALKILEDARTKMAMSVTTPTNLMSTKSLEEMRTKIARDITRARIQLLLTQPFFGNMAMSLQVILTDQEKHGWCNTAATDGKRLYMNIFFISKLTFDELLFVVAHEVLHVVFDHLSRRQGRDPEYYNMAADYVINYILVKNKIGTMPPVGLFSETYNDSYNSEQVYEMLKKDEVEIEMPLDQHLDAAGGADGNTDGDGKQKGSGKGSIKVRVKGNGDGPPVLSDEELEEIRAEVLARTIQAVQAADAQESAGCVPAGVRRMIAELTEPKLDWRSMLDATIRSQIKCDYTFTQLARVEIGGGFIFPAEDDDYVAEADIKIDTSGSMGEELLREIMSEIKGIMTTFGQFKLRVSCFDAKAYTIHNFTEQNIDEIDDFKLEGGGGTLFGCFWEQLKEEAIIPERLVVFTDGYPCDSWGDGFENYCETLWVVHGGSKTKAPWGTTVFYEDMHKN